MELAQFKLHADIEDYHWWFSGRRRIMRALVKRIFGGQPGGSVIDVGCGTGANLAALADEHAVLGVDLSEDAVTFARMRFPDIKFLYEGIPLDIGEEFPRPRLFLLMDVLEHVSDDVELLSRLTAMLTPEDTVLITVPADRSLWTEHDANNGHYRRYDVATFSATWSDLPLDLVMLTYFNTRLYPVAKIMRTISRLRGKAWGREGTDLVVPVAPVNWLLEKIFAGEANRLLGMFDSGCRGYRFGLSLLAILRASASSTPTSDH